MNRIEIPIANVQVPEVRVTSYFDQEVYEQFKRTIVKAGVIEPIVVVEVDSKFYLVDGLHRLQEAKAKGETTVPAVAIPGNEADIFLTNLFLNVMRGKTRVGEMRQVVDLLASQYHMKVDLIAKRTGMSKQYILDLVAIGKLPEEIRQAFDAGTLSKGAALALSQLSPAELQLRVYAQIAGQIVTVQDVEEIVALIREEQKKLAPPPPGSEKPLAPPPKEVECDLCHKPYSLKWLRTVLVCADCQVEHADLLVQEKKE